MTEDMQLEQTHPCPRVLVVSHNVFSAAGNMGKTMAGMLRCVPADRLAQLYFHSEVPTVDCCRRYFRITDGDIFWSVFTRKASWKEMDGHDIQKGRPSGRTDTGLKAKIYRFSRRRTPLIYLLRDRMWSLGIWKTKALYRWIKEFSPEVIFFASGDYCFSYRIACRLSRDFHIPMVTWCCDDYYLNKTFEKSPLGALYGARRRKWARQAAAQSSSMVVISDKMEQEYKKLFSLPIHVLRTPAEENPEKQPLNGRRGICYAGNLGVGRHVPLTEAGRALREAAIPGFEYIDVYSGESRPEVIAQLTEANGIRFHGAVSPGEVSRVLGKTKYLLVLESFEGAFRERVRYSLSTKVAESLRSGACILACGPEDISAMEYLASVGAACVLKAPAGIAEAIRTLESNGGACRALVAREEHLAAENHDPGKNGARLLNILQEALRPSGTQSSLGEVCAADAFRKEEP